MLPWDLDLGVGGRTVAAWLIMSQCPVAPSRENARFVNVNEVASTCRGEFHAPLQPFTSVSANVYVHIYIYM